MSKRIIVAALLLTMCFGFFACTTGAGNSGSDSYITEEDAKKIALEHANLNETDVNFVRINLDKDLETAEYEVEFYSGNAEYDYEINALTGEIISFDSDAEYYSDNKEQGEISQDDAKNIALKHAGVTEDETSRLYVSLDKEDGRSVYEVDFYVDRTEYSYEIDSATGEIISYDSEIE